MKYFILFVSMLGLLSCGDEDDTEHDNEEHYEYACQSTSTSRSINDFERETVATGLAPNPVAITGTVCSAEACSNLVFVTSASLSDDGTLSVNCVAGLRYSIFVRY